MKPQKIWQTLLLFFVCFLTFPPRSTAQNTACDSTTLSEFFNLYGGTSAFSSHSIDAVTTFIQAEEALQAGSYAQAKSMVDTLFNTYPRGNNVWWNVINDPNGANIGAPHAYYGLRMIEDILDYKLNFPSGTEAQTAYMKVVLVGCSEGIQPRNETELQNGTGPFVNNTLDPSLLADDYCLIRQSFEFFSSYVTAITHGNLQLEVEFVELPNVCMQTNVNSSQPYRASGSINPVWQALSQGVRDSTDWWWILYPSHVPEFPDFDDDSFITGGMGLDEKGGPVFIIDDKWVVRKPAHLGSGPYTDIERRIYLPQWLQHEFFHHLYRLYPELGLEVNGHDWFDRNFWPSDFVGQFETDYYSETLHKRLQTDCVPLSTKLITRVRDEAQQEFNKLNMDELLGTYTQDNILNPWHEAEIIKQGNAYYWKNKANVQWQIIPRLNEGKLETGADNPYPGQDFFLQLYQRLDGKTLPAVRALRFNGEDYVKRTDLLRGSLPIEISLGTYARVPSDTSLHTGSIAKDSGLMYWENDAGGRWSLMPDTATEVLGLDADSPSPGENFELILVEDGCGTYVLGFEYLKDYYWKPKRDSINGSPFTVNAIGDLLLQENFGSHVIDLSGVFSDPEEDSLLLFTSSSQSSFISAEINASQLSLSLSGGDLGSATIYLMALDANGGLAVEEISVEVQESVSIEDAFDLPVLIYPNPLKDYVLLEGELSDYQISIYSIDESFHREFSPAGQELRIDMSQVATGVYLILFREKDTGIIKVQKLLKY